MTAALTDKQRAAREAFDLDSAMAALPPYCPAPSLTYRGQAGVRLRTHIVADISDDLLREFAREQLRARRCSEQYLDALRVVLGNQADAERHDYVLEMNQRVTFAPERVMRTIIGQMQAAGITFGSVIGLGNGRSQVVQCFARRREVSNLTDADQLEVMNRKAEAASDNRRNMAIAQGTFRQGAVCPVDIADEDVPY